ncbi:type II toxin-antitoxin system HicB family antitoxin [Bifidobacterium avesanii]|uniref:XRE family transcriptional regulator n=1 Tax=Bifidobacterium avesanii TaxID=1798157 RepID=A0A7K3TFD3_9BIFI|nr:XRE family transcriptional regulator [Bifidobacterium avesanii]KAB8295612.1 Phage transcriptional regulator [Bifidobacterium avesanii]NEG77616.1 XRE family transcriptional regulator [Bifidobacterium avesanii]
MNVTAQAARSGKWWAISVPEIPGLFTQVRNLDEADDMVRDAARMMGIEVDAVTVQPQLNDETATLIHELNQARRTAKTMQERASSLTRDTARTLRGEGLTLRDVAAIIGLTPQRVSVLLR